jgi:hypothetical protein
MFLSLRELLPQLVQWQLLALIQQVEVENVSDSGTIWSGGITRGGGAWASNNTRGPLLTFNPIMEFFHELWWNYQGVKIEKL